MAIDSYWYRKDLVQFRDILAMFEPISEHSQGQCFGLTNRFFSTLAIEHDAWQIRYLGDPSAIFFAFKFDVHRL